MKKNQLNINKLTSIFVVVVLALLLINACKREKYTLATNDDVNITGYLDRFPEKFSMMREIIEKSGTAGFLGAYGKYTFFTPDNTAITAYLKRIGKGSVADLSPTEAKNIVRFHLLGDTLATTRFTDGRLPQITLYGQYLQTGAINEGGVSSYIVNKIAKITQSNVRLGNGIVHVIDHVLMPSTLTLAQSIAENPRYTYFAQALKETGFYDSLNVDQAAVTDTTRRFQTVILESDSALRASGFASYDSFKNRYSKTGNPKSKSDSLWLYMAYHISTGPTYTTDIITSPAIYTLAPKEVITTKFENQRILLNEDEFNGIIEPGYEINRGLSDVTAANGVMHEVKKPFTIKVRVQVPVYFDVADQPELRSNPKWRGSVAALISLYGNGASQLSGLIFNDASKLGTAQNYDYVTVPNASRKYNANDYFNLSMGANPVRAQWVEIRTPMLVKGKYKIWVCYAQNGQGPVCQIGVDVGRPDEQTMPNLVDFRQSLSASGVTSATSSAASADPLMLTNGFKRYMATTADVFGNLRGQQVVTGTSWDFMVGRLAGTVDIQTTDRHWIRFSIVGGDNRTSNTWIDMIHFIPVDADQNYPRFSTSGTAFPRP